MPQCFGILLYQPSFPLAGARSRTSAFLSVQPKQARRPISEEMISDDSGRWTRKDLHHIKAEQRFIASLHSSVRERRLLRERMHE
jgi:hypothetical protein